MEKKQRIANILFDVIRQLDAPAFKDIQPTDLNSMPLSGNLDSLGMVNLIIGMEDAFSARVSGSNNGNLCLV